MIVSNASVLGTHGYSADKYISAIWHPPLRCGVRTYVSQKRTEPLNVLHTISTLDIRAGGPVVALAGLAAAEAQAGMKVSIAATWPAAHRPPDPQFLRAEHVSIESVGPARGPLQRHPDLLELIRRKVCEADVVHIHGLWEEISYQAAIAAEKQNKPYIIVPHGMLDPWSLAQKRLKKKLYLWWRLRKRLDRAAAIHYITVGERDLAQTLKLRAPSLVEGIGLDWQEFAKAPPRGTFRSRFPMIGGRPMLLFLSRIHYKKGLDYLIDAFAQVRDRESVLVIAGPDVDGYQTEVQKRIVRAGLVDRVIFAGMLTGVDRISAMMDADLFLLPSRQENFGVVVAESLAAGTPVIISDRVNLHPQITAADVGEVVQLDSSKIATAIDTWLADPDRRRAAGERARIFARSQFDWTVLAEHWAGHYQRLIRERKNG